MNVLCLTKSLKHDRGFGRYASEVIAGLNALGVKTFTCTLKGSGEGDRPILSRNRWSFRDIPKAWRDARTIAADAAGFDLVHAMDETTILTGWFLSRMLRLPFVVTLHGTYSVVPFSQFKAIVHRRAFRDADLALPNSDFTLRLSTEAMGHPYKRAEVVSLGVSPDIIDSAPRPLSQRSRSIISVGAIKARKGVLENIRAFANVLHQVPDAKLLIAGSVSDANTYTAKVRSEIVALGLQDRVQLLGSVSQDELDELYRDARILCMPALHQNKHFEGFGLVHLEAAAKGLPVIGSIEGGNSAAIRHGETGYLINPRDPAAIEDAMVRLLTDDPLWQTMSQAAVGWAGAMSWHTTAERTAQAYRDLLAITTTHHR